MKSGSFYRWEDINDRSSSPRNIRDLVELRGSCRSWISVDVRRSRGRAANHQQGHQFSDRQSDPGRLVASPQGVLVASGPSSVSLAALVRSAKIVIR